GWRRLARTERTRRRGGPPRRQAWFVDRSLGEGGRPAATHPRGLFSLEADSPVALAELLDRAAEHPGHAQPEVRHRRPFTREHEPVALHPPVCAADGRKRQWVGR